jgi:hypothetical protein
MVIAHCKQQKFINFLLDNGCKIISNKYWDEHDVVIFEKDGETFPLMLEEVYYHFKVRKICETLGIDIPEISDELYDVGTFIKESEGKAEEE